MTNEPTREALLQRIAELEEEAARGRQAACEAKFRTLFENIEVEINFWRLVRDEDGRIKTWTLEDANPPALITWGRTLDEVRGKTPDDGFGPGTTEHFLPVVQKIMREQVPYTYDDYYPPLDKHFRFSSFPVGEDYFITLGRDITELKRALAAMKKQQELLEDMQEIAGVGGWEIDVASMATAGTTHVYRIFEVGDDYVPEMEKNLAFFTPEFRPIFEDAVRRAKDLGEPFAMDLEIITAKGNRRCLHIMGKPRTENGIVTGVRGVFQNITERTNAQVALAASEAKFSTIFESAHDAIGIMDDDVFIDCNAMSQAMFGLSKEQIIGHSVVEFAPYAQPDRRMTRDMAREIIAAVQDGMPQVFEWQYIRHDGNRLDVEVSLSSFCMDDKKYLQAIVRDVTERRALQEALKASEAKYRAIFDSAQDAITLLDRDIYIDCNAQTMKMLDRSREQIIGHSVAELAPEVQPDGRKTLDMVQEQMAAVLDGVPQFFEFENIRGDGTPFTVEINLNAVPVGNKKYIQAIVRDITERKVMQEALEASEAKYRAIFDSAHDAIFLLDGDIFQECNAQALAMFGCAREQIIGRTGLQFFRPEVQPDGRKSLEAAREKISAVQNGTPQVFEWKNVRSDGTPFDVEVAMKAFDLYGKRYIQAIVHDITERKRTEDAVRLHMAVMETVAEGIFFLGAEDYRIKWANRKLEELFGYAPGEMLGLRVDELNAPADRSPTETMNMIADYLKRNRAWYGEIKNIRKDGTPFWCAAHASLFDHPDFGSLIVSAHTDIDARKHAEAALHEMHERIRTIYENATDGLMYTAPDGRIFAANPAACAMLGRTEEELLQGGRNLLIDEHDAMLQQAIEERRQTGMSCRDLSLKRKNGTYFPAEVSSGLFTLDMDEQRACVSFRDITERKQMQARLEALANELAQKNKDLESVIYTTSHDLRSPLLNIHGNGKRLEKACAKIMQVLQAQPSSSEVWEQLRPIITETIPKSLFFINASIENMESLLQGLLQLNRLGRIELKLETLDMVQLAKKILISRDHQIRETDAAITIEELPQCRGDAMLIGQVISNLIDNALKYRDPQRALSINVSGQRKDDRCVYCVCDNGPGIALEDQERIWDLFHRLDTDLDVAGEGLGLALVRRILGLHQGRAWVESAVGSGSSFFFSLPSE